VEAFDLRKPSLIDEPEFFVRQLYRDFTGKEPEAEVVTPQVEKIRNCRKEDETCERAQVALNIFLATGFHERGFLILRMYEAGLGRTPGYEEFMDAMRRYNEVQERLLVEFAQVNNLNEQWLRERVESDELVRGFGNRAFVVLHYFGYLRRAPEASGVNHWLDILDRSGDSKRIAEGFLRSVEFRERFRQDFQDLQD
jgi:hypothetical protein